jgi:hypothetical protein
MFIDPLRGVLALRQEGHVDTDREALSQRVKETFGRSKSTPQELNMALLTEGEKRSLGSYKHGPPSGGQKVQTTEPLGTCVRKLQVHFLITP